MIQINRGFSLHPLLFATAVPLVLLVGGAPAAFAGSVTVTGANGAGGGPHQAGGAGGSATATDTITTSGDLKNSATAAGGAGGVGGDGALPPSYGPSAIRRRGARVARAARPHRQRRLTSRLAQP